ncbi:MAG: hypothetical protein IKD31_06450 [Clostridia bacterium]|nr:hypothetical protein [Clostridia bacterium]
MERFSYVLILYSVLSVLLRFFFPKEEKSPLYPPLQFLLSLLVLLSIFSPITSLFRNNPFENLQLPEEITEEDSSHRRLLEKTLTRMQESAQRAFPEKEFHLTMTVSEGQIPLGITVHCKTEETGLAVAGFLEANYSLFCTYQTEET